MSDETAIDRGTPMLTTVDNPYNPFTDFSSWLLYDDQHRHGCCAYMGSMAATSPGFTDEENNRAMEEAIDALIAADFMYKYKKVYADSYN